MDTKTILDTSDLTTTTYPFTFHGKGFEYFKIWIVNIALTIITLGIYGAWAKVRNKRYFYGNLELDNATFDYHANPLTILKGRIIALILFGAYMLTANFMPPLAIGLIILFYIAMPWIVVRSLRFNYAMTSYRNVRFRFTGSTGDAYFAVLLWPILGVLSLGLAYPLAHQKATKYFVDNSHYGDGRFNGNFTVKQFYIEYLIFFAVSILFFAGMVGIITVGTTTFGTIDENGGGSIVLLISQAAFFLFYLFAFSWFGARINANLVYNNTDMDDQNQFKSNQTVGKLAGIYFTNILAIVFSLGMMVPWAQTRLARYRAEHLKVESEGTLSDFVNIKQKAVGTLGEELGEVFDMDIGI